MLNEKTFLDFREVFFLNHPDLMGLVLRGL